VETKPAFKFNFAIFFVLKILVVVPFSALTLLVEILSYPCFGVCENAVSDHIQ